MCHGHVAASIFNAQRTKPGDRWFTFEDFHPDHAKPSVGLSGREVNQRVTREMEQTGNVVWLKE